mgnify:CR=1 FL=1
MGHRRKAREYGLQALYMHEVADTPLQDMLKLDWVEREIPDDIRDFSIALITGTLERSDEIDDRIRRFSRNWKLERMTIVDRCILRMTIFEMLFMPDIPVAVTINEGIELGKLYGGEGSGQFINGILDAIKNSELPSEE